VPNTLYNNNVEVRNRSYNIPQEEIRTHQQQVPFYYQPYENFYSPQPGSVQPMDMKRDGFISPYPPWHDNVYKKQFSPNPYPPGEYVYTQVDSNSLQSMAASINNNYDGKQNKLINIYSDEDDEELSRLNEKNKKTHVLSDLIGGPVSISPQIYASPSPIISPNYYPYKNS